MSEYTRFGEGFYDPAEISHMFFCVSYLLFGVGLVVVSFLTYWLLKRFDL
jgi:hypothetical protein